MMVDGVEIFFLVAIPSTFLYGLANIVIVRVIQFDGGTLLKNPTYRLMHYLAIQEILVCMVASFNWTVGYVSCVKFPFLEQALYLSLPPFCGIMGGIVIILAMTAVFGQCVLAFNRFAAVFFWLRYKSWFSPRNCKLIWILFVYGIPLVFYGPAMAGLVGGFVSYPGYCVCMPVYNNKNSKVWSNMVSVLVTLPVAASLVMYLAIFVKIRLADDHHQKFNRRNNAPTPAVGVRRRARNSFVFFVQLIIYLACVSQAAFFAMDAWNLEELGALPLWSMHVGVTQWGVALIVYVALNKVFRAAFVHWLKSFWIVSHWLAEAAPSTQETAKMAAATSGNVQEVCVRPRPSNHAASVRVTDTFDAAAAGTSGSGNGKL